LYSVVKTRRIRFSSVGFGLTMGSAAVAGFGIANLLSTLIYTLTQNQLAQVYVDTQGGRFLFLYAILYAIWLVAGCKHFDMF